jgi:PAS domain-containing protein
VSHHRAITALLVDVPPGSAARIQRVFDEAGWHLRAIPVQGPEALSLALQRRGWQAVFYGGEGAGAVPSRKALELVRLADPHLPFLAISPSLRSDLSEVLRGLPDDVPNVTDLATLPQLLTKALEQTRMRRRVGGAHKLLGAQQAIADHLAAGLEPDRLCDRVLATLGDSLGWTFGAFWRPDGELLRCVSLWHKPGARAAVTELANTTLGLTYAAGQGLPGRVWAFRRPIWMGDLPSEAVRAGLVTAAAFPIAAGEECAGVIELYASDAREENAEVSALFATVGGQLGAYLIRRRNRVRARRAFDGADALVVAIDAGGRVEVANGAAYRALGLTEGELLGRDWFTVAVPEEDRDAAREAFKRLLAGEGTELPPTPGISWRWSLACDADGLPIGALGWGEPVLVPVVHEPLARALR